MRFLSLTVQKCAESLTYSIIAHPVNFDIQQERSRKIWYKNVYVYQYSPLDNQYGFSISIGNKSCSYIILPWVAYCENTLTFPLSDYWTDNVGDYLYLKNGSFIFEVNPHQFNLRLHHFLAATMQLYKWYFLSVRLSVSLSVCPSVCHTFLTMFPSLYHH